MATKRIIEIEGCYNLRDIGGYPTREGGTTRWGVLLRSASPHRMPRESWKPFAELGVRTLIDLRRPSEARREGYAEHVPLGMHYKAIPLFDDEQYWTVDTPADDLSQLYERILAYCGPQLNIALRTIAEDAGTTLVHCAVGKDRTGVVIALALGAAGVDAETIAEDYAHSAALLSPLVDSFRANVQAEGGDLERLERMLESRHEVMIQTLEHLENNYGGFGSYFERIALSGQTVEQLRRRLVER